MLDVCAGEVAAGGRKAADGVGRHGSEKGYPDRGVDDEHPQIDDLLIAY